ncbi:MAG: aromatic ring-hydroxylating dioxygenase subunit alpha [Parvularculaceae bacterium]
MPTRDDIRLLPLDSAIALHPDFYADPAWFEFEKREVFAKSWQLVGPAAWAQETGDHFVADIAGVSVLVACGEDGALRAFRNICRHRGAPVVACAGKGAKRFNCPYHGWSYRLDGTLRAAPEMGGAKDFDIRDYGLSPLRLEVWMGLVFVSLSAETPPLAEFVGGIAERIAPIDLGAMRFHRRELSPVAANWKAYADNYLEGYHVPSVHPRLNEIVDYNGYTTEIERWRSMQTSAIGASAGAYGGAAVFYYLIWPNTMLNIVEGRLQTNRIVPDGHRRCVIEFDYFYTEEAAARAGADQEITALVQDEDRRICEAVQKSLASGAYQPGRLCPAREGGVWHFQNLMREAYARAF